MRRRRGKRWLWVVLPSLTCSYTPSYLPVGGALVTMNTTAVLMSMTMVMMNMPDMDQGGLNLISVPSKKAAGGKRQFLSKFFSRPICLASLCRVWMADVAALFAF